MILSSKVNRLGYPCMPRSRWSANAIIWRYAFDCARRYRVQLEILRLATRPEDVEVGFIPDFKEPLLHFLRSVTFRPVFHQGLYQSLPFTIVFWRSDISLPPEHCLATAPQILPHAPQFYKK